MTLVPWSIHTVPTAQSTIPITARTHMVGSILGTRTAITSSLRQPMVVPGGSLASRKPSCLTRLGGNLRQQGQPQNRLRSGPVRVLIPIVVVDELDALKRGSSSRTRWRAGYSVVVIDRVTVDPPRAGILNPQHSMPPPWRGDA